MQTLFLIAICMSASVCCFATVCFANDPFPLNDAEQLIADDATRLIDELETLDAYEGNARWIEAMIELSDLGPAAIPHIDAVLQTTEKESLKRRLLLVLRTFDDARAVPVVIKFIPRLCEKTGSDMGMRLKQANTPSKEVVEFLVKYCDGKVDGGDTRYDYGRPINEAFETLARFTKKQFGASEIRFMNLTSDTRRDNAVSAVFHKTAERWADWWNEHAAEFTDDARYHTVSIPPLVEREGPSPLDPGAKVKVVSRRSNTTISPIDAEGKYARCFLDLDTGRTADGRNRWQGEPLDEMIAWAKKEGFDVMAIEREDRGATKYTLVPLAAKFWQISRADGEEIEKYLGKQGQIVLGETGEFLLDYDSETKTYGDDPQPAFLYETEFGCVGVIFIDSDVTELFKFDKNGRVINGGPVRSTPPERGFSYGVKITHHAVGVEDD